jgi:hypothetical protein
MNIALEKTEEHVNGKLRQTYGDAFVRGNNGNLARLAWFNATILTMCYSFVHLRTLKGFPRDCYCRQ